MFFSRSLGNLSMTFCVRIIAVVRSTGASPTSSFAAGFAFFPRFLFSTINFSTWASAGASSIPVGTNKSSSAAASSCTFTSFSGSGSGSSSGAFSSTTTSSDIITFLTVFLGIAVSAVVIGSATACVCATTAHLPRFCNLFKIA